MNLELNIEINPAIAHAISITDSEWQNWFQTWLNILISTDSLKVELTHPDTEVSLLLTGDQEIQALNHQYRHQNRPTDVLAFAALESEIPTFTSATPDEYTKYTDEYTDHYEYSEYAEPTYLGDIVISVDTALAQAQTQNHSISYELIWLAAHGFLHLLGWDHPDDQALEAMLHQQDMLLAAI
jgi:probable rRNA maturation factor